MFLESSAWFCLFAIVALSGVSVFGVSSSLSRVYVVVGVLNKLFVEQIRICWKIDTHSAKLEAAQFRLRCRELTYCAQNSRVPGTT
jgi:Zn finger protein HypA/HybF involved in hydrogenase expression